MKPNTYSQIHIQAVFAVAKGCLIRNKEHRDILYKYVSEIVTNKGHKSLIVNGHVDHIHVFFGYDMNMLIPDLIRDIKRSSSLIINSQKWLPRTFRWQSGYGAFSYSYSHVKNVYRYILNQEQRHKKWTFRAEYYDYLEKFEVLYDDKYLFEFFD